MNLTLEELMKASDETLWLAVDDPARHRASAAIQVTSDYRLLDVWRLRHQYLLQPVAAATGRFGQPARLRAAAVLLIERCALIDYLREYGVDKRSRDAVIALMRGTASRREMIDEHRNYVLALCSALCIDHLLWEARDPAGPRLLKHYRQAYLDHFAAFCDEALRTKLQSQRLNASVALSPEVQHLKHVLTDLPESAVTH